MTDNLVCAYIENEALVWYVNTYDYEITSVGFHSRRCPFCKSTMRNRFSDDETFLVADCKFCGFWRVIKSQGLGGFRNKYETPAWRGVAKYYDTSDVEVPLADLRRFLFRKPNHLANVNPFVFEELMADCLRSAFPGCEIAKIGGVRDRGIDLILVRANGESYLVQVKRRSNIEKKETVEVVRQLNGVLFRENIPRGLVITTAHHYTRDAIDETWVNVDGGVWKSIDLYGYQDIVDWLALPSPSPYEPWKSVCGTSEFTNSNWR